MDAINTLDSTVKALRAPDGCPWDKEQTFKSLTPHVIEEAYELVEALESNNPDLLLEELGDVLLHVVMIASMAEEENLFSLVDVATAVNEKMIRRHPHVFGDKRAQSVEEVWTHWEAEKKKEKNTESVMDSLPKLPALLQAEKIQKKASRQGFDWPDKKGPLEKLKEECLEFEESLTKPLSIEEQEEEAGDILFTIVNCLRKLNINPETALRKANNKFISRYKSMESQTSNFKSLSLEEKEVLWKKSK